MVLAAAVSGVRAADEVAPVELLAVRALALAKLVIDAVSRAVVRRVQVARSLLHGVPVATASRRRSALLRLLRGLRSLRRLRPRRRRVLRARSRSRRRSPRGVVLRELGEVLVERLHGVRAACERLRPRHALVTNQPVDLGHELLVVELGLRERHPEVVRRVDDELFHPRQEGPDILQTDVGALLRGVQRRQDVVLGVGPDLESTPPSLEVNALLDLES